MGCITRTHIMGWGGTHVAGPPSPEVPVVPVVPAAIVEINPPGFTYRTSALPCSENCREAKRACAAK